MSTQASSYNLSRPTVKIIGRHHFFSKENNEPPHIHVESAENAAKFWLSPIELVWQLDIIQGNFVRFVS